MDGFHQLVRRLPSRSLSRHRRDDPRRRLPGDRADGVAAVGERQGVRVCAVTVDETVQRNRHAVKVLRGGLRHGTSERVDECVQAPQVALVVSDGIEGICSIDLLHPAGLQVLSPAEQRAGEFGG